MTRCAIVAPASFAPTRSSDRSIRPYQWNCPSSGSRWPSRWTVTSSSRSPISRAAAPSYPESSSGGSHAIPRGCRRRRGRRLTLGQEPVAAPEVPADPSHQAVLLEERGEGREADRRHLAVVRVGLRLAVGAVDVEPGPVVDPAVGERPPEHRTAEPVEVADEEPLEPGRVLHPVDDALARELDVPGLLGDVDPHQLRDDRLQVGVGHDPALLRVEDLLADQGADPQQRAAEEVRECGGEEPVGASHPVGAGADPVDHLAEHRHVPALVTHLGEHVVRERRRRVLTQQLQQQPAVQDVLEPQADREDVGELLAGERDPLLLGELLPVGGAVEGDDLLGEEVLALLERGVPVDRHGRFVRTSDRPADETAGHLVGRECGALGRGRHVQPLPEAVQRSCLRIITFRQ